MNISGSIKPRWFFTGILTGFAVCSLLGWSVSRHNFYKNFLRPDIFIEARGSYYPTLGQLRQVVLAQCPPEKITVIIGGSSIFNGVGQPDDALWTKSLQQKLGDRYAVINLALPASPAPSAALLVARSLHASGRKIIFVTNIDEGGPLLLSFDDNYSYMFWEAYFGGFVKMQPWQIEAACHPALWVSQKQQALKINAIRESRESARLDRWLYFRDLWDYVSYNYFSTIWNGFFRDHWFAFLSPRRGKVGATPLPPAPLETREKIWAAEYGLHPDLAVTSENYCKLVAKDASGNWIETAPEAWRILDERIQNCLARDFNANTLLVFIPLNPWFTNKASTGSARLARNAVDDFTCKHLRAAGCETIPNNGALTAGDFLDILHLTPSGGEKIAAMAAPKVEELAARLGYLDLPQK